MEKDKDKDKGLTYKDAGVDIDAANEAVERIKSLVASTRQPWVLAAVGPFSGSLRLKPIIETYQDPVLLQSTDGAGTKIMVAETMNKLDTIGIDLVYHCANDLITAGPVEFVSFLDYIGTDKLLPAVIEQIMIGLAMACQEVECPIVGGEMAEMPDIYKAGEHDLIGFMTGVIERDKLIDGSKIQPGDQLIALASSGLHTNGYSLARRALPKKYGVPPSFDVIYGQYSEELGGITIGEALLVPHRLYANIVRSFIERNDEPAEVHGLAHITGGGLKDNIRRILPEGCRAVVYKNRWPVPKIFSFLQRVGGIAEEEMFRAFNMGIGFVVVVPPWRVAYADQTLNWLCDALLGRGSGGSVEVFQIGDIKEGERGVEIV